MRKYETQKYEKKVEIREREILTEVSCDLCGATARDEDDWSTSGYDVEETVISQKDGSSYPEGGSGTEYRVDMCPKCFKEKLIPWLESQGCKAKRTEWDW